MYYSITQELDFITRPSPVLMVAEAFPFFWPKLTGGEREVCFLVPEIVS
jgi:hypothetical protein